MEKLRNDNFSNLLQRLDKTDDYQFYYVYGKEAHTDDTWNLGIGIDSWNTTEDCVERANKMKSGYPHFRWLADSHNHLFDNYQTWPERVLIIENNKIIKSILPNECHSSKWIEKLLC
jgi:hypothetical protein